MAFNMAFKQKKEPLSEEKSSHNRLYTNDLSCQYY